MTNKLCTKKYVWLYLTLLIKVNDNYYELLFKIFKVNKKLEIIKKTEKSLSKSQERSILKILPEIKKSSKTIIDMIESLSFIITEGPIKLNEDSKEILTVETKENIEKIKKILQTLDTWDTSNIEQLLKDFSISEGLKFKDIALPLRAILTGTLSSPSIYNILDCLGKDEVINRINDIL